ncbi:MAG: hypothetical protein ISN29_02170 [Gammaproteobacteria bacterium AqS3]|nr:hypothetical protein [Gammaproteobacteria bacterium AqS3]
MITKADDFPIHQTPNPIAHPESERNFYDRYFFSGYSLGEGRMFNCAMGVYPNQQVADAAFSIVHEGRQHNLRSSRALVNLERLDTRVGPIAVEVAEPLHTLVLHVDDGESGVRAELVFTRRCAPQEEPRHGNRIGNVLAMDATRMTQNGTWSGWYEIDGTRIEVDGWMGTRDRSWGIRSVGAQPPPLPVSGAPQFHWLWTPTNFPTGSVFFHCNSYADGSTWNRGARWVGADDAIQTLTPNFRTELIPGTRHPSVLHLDVRSPQGHVAALSYTPKLRFYMSGLGYLHPEWGHGSWHGEAARTYDIYDPSNIDDTNIAFFHTQGLCEVEMSGHWGEHQGVGLLEHLIIGPHEPSGLTGLDDTA